MRKKWRVLKQDSAGGANTAAKKAEISEKLRRQAEESRKSMKNSPIFRKRLTCELVIEKQEKMGAFRTSTLEKRASQMVEESNPEKAVELAKKAGDHVAWQLELIGKIKKLPRGEEMIRALKEKAKQVSPEKMEELLVKIDSNIRKSKQKE